MDDNWATTKKRYNDTAIHGAGAGLFKLINDLINYCFQSPQEISNCIFRGGGGAYT